MFAETRNIYFSEITLKMGSQSSTVDFEGVLAASEKGSPLIIGFWLFLLRNLVILFKCPKNCIFLDVRGHDEFAAGYIPRWLF